MILTSKAEKHVIIEILSFNFSTSATRDDIPRNSPVTGVFSHSSQRGPSTNHRDTRINKNHRPCHVNQNASLEGMLREIVPELVPRHFPSTKNIHNKYGAYSNINNKIYNNHQVSSPEMMDKKTSLSIGQSTQRILGNSIKTTPPNQRPKTRPSFTTEIQESYTNINKNLTFPSQTSPAQGNALNLRKIQSTTTVQTSNTNAIPANLINELKERLAERSNAALRD